MRASSNTAIGYNHAMLATNSVPPEGVDSAIRSLQAHGLIVLILATCLIGLVVILMLLRTWRRYNERLNRSHPKPQPLTDVWHAAVERLTEAEQGEGDDDRAGPDEDEPDDPDAPPSGDL